MPESQSMQMYAKPVKLYKACEGIQGLQIYAKLDKLYKACEGIQGL